MKYYKLRENNFYLRNIQFSADSGEARGLPVMYEKNKKN